MKVADIPIFHAPESVARQFSEGLHQPLDSAEISELTETIRSNLILLLDGLLAVADVSGVEYVCCKGLRQIKQSLQKPIDLDNYDQR